MSTSALHTPHIPSRLPDVGTTIFTVMSALATECNAVNLGQGFPDFEGDPRLPQAVSQAMQAGLNQYPPMAGIASLRAAISDKTFKTIETIALTLFSGGHNDLCGCMMSFLINRQSRGNFTAGNGAE